MGGTGGSLIRVRRSVGLLAALAGPVALSAPAVANDATSPADGAAADSVGGNGRYFAVEGRSADGRETSYDYRAPLGEADQLRQGYFATNPIETPVAPSDPAVQFPAGTTQITVAPSEIRPVVVAAPWTANATFADLATNVPPLNLDSERTMR